MHPTFTIDLADWKEISVMSELLSNIFFEIDMYQNMTHNKGHELMKTATNAKNYEIFIMQYQLKTQ